jgi:hypothetical protein
MFIVGFLSYEILKTMEAEWNKVIPNNEAVHFANRKSYHFVAIFLGDLFVLYLIVLLFGVHL